MLQNFLNLINKLYRIIISDFTTEEKIISINKYKELLEIKIYENFGQHYTKEKFKESGTVYTPIEISEYIIENTILKKNVINNPHIKIADPSCGCGNIIIPCFKYLHNIYEENLSEINSVNSLDLTINNISKHIIRNNLFGFDLDEDAIKILIIDLFCESKEVSNNFNKLDFLISDLAQQFDIYIGNPPYIGHKMIDKDYYIQIKNLYEKVYSHKSDISYCFFYKSLLNIPESGKLTYITSRYFMESPSGEKLREFITQNFCVYKIVDFYGNRPFKNIGIDPVIIFIKKKENKAGLIEVIKPFQMEEKYNKQFYILEERLRKDGWILIDDEEMKIVSKIEERCKVTLDDICDCYQGVITGCDKAFIVDEKTIENEHLEKSIIKPWIKSSNINKNMITKSAKYLINSNLIDNIEKYPNVIKHIEAYKEKLCERRECKKGMRKWYELQWGRKQFIFENRKIIFPYKASNNRFAIDDNSFFSADVYALTLKKNINLYSYDFILFILNSKLYEFYFKCTGKKLGEDLYEYYPNKLLKLRVPPMNVEIMDNEEELYSYFNLTEKEITVIKPQKKA